MVGRRAWEAWVGSVVAIAWLGVACSSSSNGGGPSSCFASDVTGACNACVQSSCSEALSAASGACKDYLSCACPGGSYDASQAMTATCQQALAEDSCTTSVGTFEGCKAQHCAAACGIAVDAGSDGEVDAGGVVATDGGSSGGGSVEFSCTKTTAGKVICTLGSVPAAQLHAAQQTCASGQGTSGTTCSTTGLAGCCKISVVSEACYYDAMPATDQGACTQQGGTWSTTP
jgi:hypothetical protein